MFTILLAILLITLLPILLTALQTVSDHLSPPPRRYIYGLNEILVEVQSVFQVLFNEILGPFYVFQIFSIIIWSTDDYYYYASCIVIMSAISLATSVIQIRKNQKQLRDTVKGLDNVTVCLDGGRCATVDSTKLVPGDIIAIPSHGCVMQCDAVLISGECDER